MAVWQRKNINYREKKKWTGTKTPEQLAAEKAKRKGEALPGEESDNSEEEEQQVQSEPEDDPYKGDVDSFLEKGFFQALEAEETDDDDDDGGKEGDDGEDGSDGGGGGDDDGSDDGEGADSDADAGGDGDDGDAEESHKQDLEMLKREQPEFFKYLQENDEELLKFGQESDGGCAGDGGSDAEDGVEDGGREEGGKEEEAVPVVTLKLLSGWARALGKGGAAFGTLRDLVPPPPPSRTKWTRFVHPSVLIGHVSSL